MKAIHPSIHPHSINLFRAAILTTVLVVAGCMTATNAHAQLYAAGLSGTIGEYDTSTGAAINASLVNTGLNFTYGVAVSGTDLFTASHGASAAVGVYNATTGAAINPSLISGAFVDIAVSGNDLYTLNENTISEYNATTGTVIDATLVTGLAHNNYLTISGNDIYTTGYTTGIIGEYDATTGDAISASLITGLTSPEGVVVSGNDLYVVSNGVVGEYNATTGAAINASLISAGITAPYGIAISGTDLYVANGNSIGEYNANTRATIDGAIGTGIGTATGLAVEQAAVPEPSSVALLAITAGGAFLALRRRRATV